MLYILFLLNLISIYLVDLFTVKFISGKGISGNGNPGVFFLVVSILLYVLFIILLIHFFMRKNFTKRLKVLKVCITILFLSIIIICDLAYIKNILSNLHQIKEFGLLNQYTNTLFVNYYHFFIGLLIVYLIFLITGKNK
ncbi:hypothetical protein EBB07_02770 [Paenibacillaceae bacterium]|nr:hypothetical protein EBB07_02770 [Paenibacillaceae bacterium]